MISSSEINREFKIKVFGMHNGVKINTLVGTDGYYRIIEDEELADKLVRKAQSKGVDKFVAKLRRGIKVTFYASF